MYTEDCPFMMRTLNFSLLPYIIPFCIPILYYCLFVEEQHLQYYICRVKLEYLVINLVTHSCTGIRSLVMDRFYIDWFDGLLF